MFENIIEVNSAKTVEKVIFEQAGSDYYVMAVTFDVYSNLELDDIAYEMDNAKIIDADDVTEENAELAAEGARAYIELYNRGFTLIVNETSLADYEAILAKANEIIAAANGEIVFTPGEIVSDSEKASCTVTMTNTTAKDQSYVLVIAAYNENGDKLLDLNIGEAKTLTAGSENVTDSIEMPSVANASYKVFIWESISSLKPIE